MTHPNCYVDCKDTKINSQNNYSHEKYFLILIFCGADCYILCLSYVYSMFIVYLSYIYSML